MPPSWDSEPASEKPPHISSDVWEAAGVGITARCDRHIDNPSDTCLMFCQDCLVAGIKRAQDELVRVSLQAQPSE